ncbi:MAG: cupredoxin family copper-binding protein [Gemmatimonadota bacterium]|nr:MAG: cupredoxin family copper-binding protein [Gemmatimonadota bacterium]
MNWSRRAASTLLLFTCSVLAAGPVVAQPVTHRTPNIEGTWVTSPWNLHFQLNHRFRVFGEDADVVDLFDEGALDNSPTFNLSLGLWSPAVIGVQYASSPAIVNGSRTNEWFPYLKLAPLREGDWSVSLLGGYNTQAESFDGELAGQASLGPVEFLGSVRGFTDALHTGQEGLVLTGGALLHLTDFLALAGDVGGFVAGPDTSAAWSAGIQVGIPFTPHTFSLQVSNATATTLQEASFAGTELAGGGLVWGFEFTVPFSGFARWGRIFDRGGGSGQAAGREEEPARLAEVDMREMRLERDTIHVAAGSSIRWVNRDHVAHTVVADDGAWKSPLVGPGETYTTRLNSPGEFSYVCTLHPFMRGVIIVEDRRSTDAGR